VFSFVVKFVFLEILFVQSIFIITHILCCRFVFDCLGASLAMATAVTVSSSGPRYAPEDPTLPKPWKGLVDGKTGYLYFWNPDTNVTQYERPTSFTPPKSTPAPISSSVQVQQSSQGQRHGYGPDEDGRYGRGINGGSKPEAGSRSQQVCTPLVLANFVS
jgi:hypothetical protein